MELFYGKAECSTCHSGQFQTDHGLHAIAMPQIGPGKAARFESHARDEGRMRLTDKLEDAYKVHTPSLRNIAETAPYGHSGAYAKSKSVIEHHLDPQKALQNYDRSQLILPDLPNSKDFIVMSDPQELAAIAPANELQP